MVLTPIKVETRRIIPVIQAKLCLTKITSAIVVAFTGFASANHRDSRAENITFSTGAELADDSLLDTTTPTIFPAIV